ncbi:MAG: excinuclease ABC subunit UvrA, partial [Clostridia bacterium]|nr:excinuclease ABC subunit UvrA [Deltaproteobacteria bacterium]
MDRITVRGAREHNLKNISIEIPRDKLVVFTGLSGSGKSSLAFDTIYAEGQRRYVESLSAYARQFLEQNSKPDLDAIDGLSPAIAIEQKTSGHNPRSTVGTLTEISDYMRVLYASIGEVYCPSCGKRIAAQTVQQMVDAILALPDGTKLNLLAPVVRENDQTLGESLNQLRKDGFVRVRIAKTTYEIDEVIDRASKLDKSPAEIVVDRLIVRPDGRTRTTDSVELALKKGDGQLTVAVIDGEDIAMSERHTCCGNTLPELTPQLFSFNSPTGACPSCAGLGYTVELDPERIVPDHSLSINDGAIKPWASKGGFYGPQLKSVAKHFEVSLGTPWKKLPKKARDAFLFGTGDTELNFKYESKKSTSKFTFKKAFEGVIPILTRKLHETENENVRADLDPFLAKRVCPVCEGTRYKPEARMVRVGGLSVDKTNNLSVTAAIAFFDELKLAHRETEIAKPLVKEIRARLSFMQAVGLAYLSLDRASMTLSGGEAQRIRLATQVGSALQGVIYVLDEPSIGLHQRDNERLLNTLISLRDLGNSVLVVEHDEDTIRAADHIIDIGPGAGIHGGEVVAQGSVSVIENTPRSLTGDYLAGRRSVPVPATRSKGNGHHLIVTNAHGNNLKGIDVEVPLGCFVCVTGVSGSGKSTLVNDTLYIGVARALGLSRDVPAAHEALGGFENLDKVIDIDQSPIGRTPRSNPSTYTGIFGVIRDLFAQLPEARTRGYGPGRFSFNVKGVRCEKCQGDGVIKIEMHFLP